MDDPQLTPDAEALLRENEALRGLLIELMDNMVCDGEGQCHGLGKDKIKEDIETRIAAALGDA